MPSIHRPKELFLQTAAGLASEPLIVPGVNLTRGAPMSPKILYDIPTLSGHVDHSWSPEIVYYSAKKPLASVRGFDLSQRRVDRVTGLSGRSLIEKLQETSAQLLWEGALGDSDTCSARSWWYYSIPHQTPAGQHLGKYLSIDVLVAASQAAASAVSTDRARARRDGLDSKVNLWIGGGELTASCHYDSSTNVFAQLHGTKRFELWPPAASEQMQPYSFLHPHFRRAQQIPKFHFGKQVIELVPGDVLLLPPFWWHRVTALSSVSISANAWTSDHSVVAAQKLVDGPTRWIFGARIFAGLTSSSNQTRAAIAEELALKIIALAHGSHDESSARRFLHTNMLARWQSVYARYPRALRRLTKFCSPLESTARSVLAQQHLLNMLIDGAKWAEGAIRAAEAVRALPLYARDIVICDMVEAMSMELLEDTKTAASFLTHCFAPHA